MRRILYIMISILSIASVSCKRDALTYSYDPRCEIEFQLDWSGMETAPTGMSIYCYPVDGGTPTTLQSNTITSATVKLSQGVYNILIFNQIPSDFGTITFEGLSSYETACVTAVSTKSSWYASKSSDDTLVRDPEALSVATYEGFEVTENDIREVLGLQALEDEGGETKSGPDKILSLTPRKVDKQTRVRIRISQIQYIYSTRASIYGMASGYNFSTQKSNTSMVTHLLEDWTTTFFDEDDGYIVLDENLDREGEVEITFSNFGLPDQTTMSRSSSSWSGSMSLEILLADRRTIYSQEIDLSDKASSESRADLDLDLYIDIGYSGDEDDQPLTLPEVVPEGEDESGFSVDVSDWGDVENVVIPMK